MIPQVKYEAKLPDRSFARIAVPVASVRTMIHELLVNVGKEHPQALVFPLVVALKSQAPQRVAAAESVMAQISKHSSVLVEQATRVSQELVRGHFMG